MAAHIFPVKHHLCAMLPELSTCEHGHKNIAHCYNTTVGALDVTQDANCYANMSRADLAEQRCSVRAAVDVFTKSDHQSDGAQTANIHLPWRVGMKSYFRFTSCAILCSS